MKASIFCGGMPIRTIGSLLRRERRKAYRHERQAADEEQTARLVSRRLGSMPSEQRVLVSPSVEDGLRILERVFNFYSDVSEQSDDEEIAREALAFAGGAVRRLALVRGELGALGAEGCRWSRGNRAVPADVWFD
jgi:hypothetical protein